MDYEQPKEALKIAKISQYTEGQIDQALRIAKSTGKIAAIRYLKNCSEYRKKIEIEDKKKKKRKNNSLKIRKLLQI